MPEPIVEEELAYVLAEAVEAYKVAALRDRSTGSYSFRGYTAEVLIKKFPKRKFYFYYIFISYIS